MPIFDKLKFLWNCPGGYKHLLTIAYPLFFFSASTAIMQFCDVKFLGNYNTDALAAALPSGHFIMALGALLFFTMNYCGPMIAQSFGARETSKCVDILWTGVKAAVLCSVIEAILLPLIGYFTLPLFLKGSTLDLALTYFMIQVPGQIFICLSAPFNAFYGGRGKTTVVSFVNIIGAMVNIFLNWVLIFGHFGIPSMGIFGAGLATSLSMLVSLLIIVCYTLYNEDQSIYPTRDYKRFNSILFKKLFRYGLPSGFQLFSNQAKFAVVLLLVGTLGDLALAASNIPLTMNAISFMPMIAITEANLIISGQFLGRKKHKNAIGSTFNTYILTSIYTSCVLVFFALFSKQIFGFFAPENNNSNIDFNMVKDLSYYILLTVAGWQIIDAVRWSYGSLLRAAGDTKALMKINLFCSWVICVPIFVITTQFTNLPVNQVWLFFPIFCICESSLVFWRFKSDKWRNFNIN